MYHSTLGWRVIKNKDEEWRGVGGAQHGEGVRAMQVSRARTLDLKLRVVQFGALLDLRTTASQNGEAVPRRARI